MTDLVVIVLQAGVWHGLELLLRVPPSVAIAGLLVAWWLGLLPIVRALVRRAVDRYL